MLESTSALDSDDNEPTFDESPDRIDMKGFVGDAVGNMSISPTNRDVVLAARKGLFIIDLDHPLEVPRFLPQGGTWDVADVQWNPHPSHGNYIVSTSSEKLLIWNLLLDGKTSIEHILSAHYRAITDINWHTTDPNIVVSTGIDAWLWAWDLRTTPKPILGLCAFSAGGTQVKWNRQDENILASSHMNKVFIWDRRKGSLPISSIEAHAAKIYGIDWSHDRRDEIVTCSLDRTIKVFDVQMRCPENSSVINQPKVTFQTSYPVWRARDLPFGRGVLSLPQRGENALEMFAHDNPQDSAKIFEGHTDVVKEFVWRRGGQDYDEFQLITWSKDKTLRFWPIDAELIRKMGPKCIPPNPMSQSNISDSNQASFRSSPHTGYRVPPLSVPVGHILAEVRAPPPSRRPQPVIPLSRVEQSHEISPPRRRSFSQVRKPSVPVSIANNKGSTMTRGNVGGISSGVDTLTWWSKVKVGKESETSSGDESGITSRVNSRSRRNSESGGQEKSGILKRSESKIKREEEAKENEVAQSLQDEITSVIAKLAPFKIRLEKHDLTKKRTCTLGLHGPWGQKSSVFIRITFTFPKDYPQAAHPGGTAKVDLERNPLISMKDRAFMLRRLRDLIGNANGPCLEVCLKFLIFGDESERIRRNSESSSDDNDDDGDDDGDGDENPRVRKSTIRSRKKEVPYSLLRNDKNLAEPRTSQGVFGPNGELVCFSRAPPRIVRNPLHDISVSPSMRSLQAPDSLPRLFRSPALLSDAINQLSLASNDRASLYPRRPEDAVNILRIMTNLLTFSERKRRRPSERSKPADDMSYSLLPPRRSTVLIKNTGNIVNPDRQAASDYILDVSNPGETCQKNAMLARKRGRFDHEWAFKLLKIFVETRELYESPSTRGRGPNPVRNACTKLYGELCLNKDVQMLAMMSIIILSCDLSVTSSQVDVSAHSPRESRATSSLDYHSSRGKESRTPSASPGWYRGQVSPGSLATTGLSSPPSSRGSWSSLFNTGTMRNFISGPQEASEPAHIDVPGQIPVPRAEEVYKELQRTSSNSPLRKAIVKPWSDPPSSAPTKPATRSPNSHPSFSQIVSTHLEKHSSKKLVVTSVPRYDSPNSRIGTDQQRRQLMAHIDSYAEVLLRWQLLRQRAELIKAVRFQSVLSSEEYRIGVVSACSYHRDGVESSKSEIYASCKVSVTLPRCSVCRLRVRGLSRSCTQCGHTMHVKCWKDAGDACATGCGCACLEIQ